ncbi:adhesion G protein-coupled receptor E3-like [Mizuhopecten yessoensis]|uniref:Brain-specific angiogenesis inhibitor 1 n=1 Tax=Mizuhopecten yessoensis TaxID=6573 RepID=A0A210QTD1_MIZYE|nr:adhesion G protein-coupled receptor E3-like [Mizuhopecten yessoensis]OWF51975.1 Brain-specific angiogenesis inhibitor 1 [Mizuhopecten yessoensis]
MKLNEILLCLLWILTVKAAVCPDGGITNHNLPYDSLYEEGERVTLPCQFFAPADCGPITWGKIPSGQPVIPSTRIRIDDVTNETALYSTLTIDPVSVRDEGGIFCSLKQVFIQFYIQIIPLPMVVISPLFKAAKEGSDVIVTCNVTNQHLRHFNDTFQWCHGSNTLQDTMHADNMSISRLFLSNVAIEDSGQYRCGVRGYGDTCANMKHVSILEVYRTEGTNFCKEVFDDHTGLTWIATPAGNIVTQPCMANFTGVVERNCGADGVWGVVVTIGCVRQEIQSALEDLIHLETTPGNAEVIIGNVIASISEITTNPASLTSGDLNSTTAVLEKIVAIITNTAETVLVNEQKFVGIIDDMLAEDNLVSWAEVNDKSSDAVASNLMKIIENFGLIFSRTVTTANPIILNKKNMNVEFRRINLTTPMINFHPEQTLNGSEVGISLNLDSDTSGNLTYTAAFYRTISEILPKSKSYGEFASEVISLSIGSGIETNRLSSPVMLAFDVEKLKRKNNLSGDLSIRCVFWDFGIKQWSSNGCRYVNESCQCDHLTNFAVLMSPIQILDEVTLISLRIITIVGCSISVVGTVLTMLTYLGLWRNVKNDQARLLMNLCAALTVAYVLFLTGIDKTEDNIFCTTIAALLHYFFLVTFCLMLAEGIILLMSVTVVFYSKSKLKWLLFFGWGTPAIVVGTTIGITHGKEYHSQHHCWLTLSNGVLYSFAGPAVAIILVNVAVIVRVQKAIYSSHFIVTKTQRQKIMTGVRSISILLPVLGVTWLFGILAVNADLVVFQYVFALANSLQGFFIFLCYCVFSVPIRRALERKIKLLTSAALSSKENYKIQVIKTKPTNYTVAKYALTNGVPTPFKKATSYQQASLVRRFNSFTALPNIGSR